MKRNEWRTYKTTLETSGEDLRSHAMSEIHNVEMETKALTVDRDPSNRYIFPTRFECNFTSSPLVSSVVFIFHRYTYVQKAMKSRYRMPNLPNEERELLLEGKTTLETSEEDVELHSKRVEKM